MRLTPEAVEQAKLKLGIADVDDLWQRLGFRSRMTFWRVRRGRYDIRFSHAIAVAELIGWPLSRTFKGPADA